ncbi:MAG: hypothetical protein EAX86_03145 [Candidatus Heimdallarchaeota archaeon]|nr:hypothetical protein [Candidatus Heimdallarchaeota archaeon]
MLPHSGNIVSYRLLIRKDPITGQSVVISSSLSEKMDLFIRKTDWKLVESLMYSSAKKCPFCIKNLTLEAPKFPRNLGIPEPLSKGEAIVIPNLYPQWEHHAVVILTKDHFILPNQITGQHLRDGLVCSLKYFKSIHQNFPESYFASINLNYLHPAGATLPHPHLQLLVSSIPTNHQKLLLKREIKFSEKYRKRIWEELVFEEQKRNQRYLGNSSGVHWILPYSPLGDYEIRAIFPTSNFLDLKEEEIETFCYIVSNIISKYQKLGISSFNFSLIGYLCTKFEKSSNITFSIVPRQNIYENYRNDINFLGFLQNTRFLIYSPEDYFCIFQTIFES